MLRKGLVVATHVEDNSVDLVMADNGERLAGVQVITLDGSTRTGTADLPLMPEKNNKWDVTERTEQDMIAIVGSVSGIPVVVGFIYPQINQILPKAGSKRKIKRHQSDVQHSIDGDGNIQILHPSGTYVRIGESPDYDGYDGQNADGNAVTDRNTSHRVNVRIGLAGGKGTVTITPDGAVSFIIASNFTIDSGGDATIKCNNATINAPKTSITGDLAVAGDITCDKDVVASSVSLVKHLHGGVLSGPSKTSAPIPT